VGGGGVERGRRGGRRVREKEEAGMGEEELVRERTEREMGKRGEKGRRVRKVRWRRERQE
jgi:hypothetical protein